MQKYLGEVIERNEHGLYICQLPTGYGKSYAVMKVIASMVSSSCCKRKIIYLTTTKKNLPSDMLRKMLNNDELYERNVLKIRSNLDEVREKPPDMDIPEKFRTPVYTTLIRELRILENAEKSKNRDTVYLSELTRRCSEAECKFHKEIERFLKGNFKSKMKRLEAIKSDSDYKWIGRLYPAVFTDERSVLMMTVSKFLHKNTTLIEPSYDFLSASVIENAVVFIDESDAAKDAIINHIIDRTLQIRNEYISVFRQIYNGLIPESMSDELQSSCNMVKLKQLRVLGDELTEQYHLNLSYKTADTLMDCSRNFLFHDSNFHTILQNNKKYIRTAVNCDSNRVEIHFEDKGEFYSNRSPDDIVIYSMLRDVRGYLKRFGLFVYKWAENYRKLINQKRNDMQDEISTEASVYTILNKLGLSDSQKNFMLGEVCSIELNSSNNKPLPEKDFYSVGMEIFELEDSDIHNDTTYLQFIKVQDTPEKILRYLAENATVFAISATADIPTVIGNFNLSYLSSVLGRLYHPMDEKLQERVYQEMQGIWEPYRKGKVRVHTEVLKAYDNRTDIEQFCLSLFNSTEHAEIAAALITNYAEDDYTAKRYCNLLKVMHSFWKHKSIHSMLCLEMVLPKQNYPAMDEELLKKLLSVSKADTDESKDTSGNDVLVVLRSFDFDEAKEELLKRLGRGEKLFVMSTYSTIGAGQNLQYDVSDKSEYVELTPCQDISDKRHFTKDFDAVYLGNITHMTVNTYAAEPVSKADMLRMLFQAEELYHNGELNFYQKERMIKLAFRSHNSNTSYETNLIYQTQSVGLQATRQIIQAIGRMCRTFLKNTDIYIFITEETLKHLDVSETKKRIIPPEMESLAECREQLGRDYSQEEERVLNLAERISSEGMWKIRSLLSRGWTQESMSLWENLRKLTLTCPTASTEIYLNNELIKELYITSGTPQNQYLFSQYSDFNDVTIDFKGNEVEFRNSKRAKLRGESDETVVMEMSEKSSRLPYILKYNGMREYFKANHFATSFAENPYLMSPVLFHNIYKGALGEVSGAFILKQELGIELKPITEPEKFEFFDYMISADVYVDFKNWKYSYQQDKQSIHQEIIRKLDSIGGKRVYVINIVNETNAEPTISCDGRITEIPGLIDKNGNIITDALYLIQKEDYKA